MAKTTISGQTAFQCNNGAFAINATTSGYTLQYSVDRTNWTSYGEDTPAGEVFIVTNKVGSLWYRLSGNTDSEVIIAY